MIDQPSYDFDKKDDENIKLNSENAEDIANYINSMM